MSSTAIESMLLTSQLLENTPGTLETLVCI